MCGADKSGQTGPGGLAIQVSTMLCGHPAHGLPVVHSLPPAPRTTDSMRVSVELEAGRGIG
jgi:hypothetical protein